jgi:hypothetical protein
MSDRTDFDKHPPITSIILHLLPGLIIGLVYFVLKAPTARLGYPSIMALMVSIAIALIPLELGYLIIQGFKRNKKFSLEGIVTYRVHIPFWNYLVYIPVLFIGIGLVFTLLKPLDRFLWHTMFSWIPQIEGGLQKGFTREILVKTYVMVAVFGMILGPIVEELYFRGYLLPRMKYAGKFSPLIHSFLFSIYHVFTPWMIVTRTVGMIPLAYAVKRKNLNISMIVHILINSIDVIMGMVFIMGMGGIS